MKGNPEVAVELISSALLQIRDGYHAGALYDLVLAAGCLAEMCSVDCFGRRAQPTRDGYYLGNVRDADDPARKET